MIPKLFEHNASVFTGMGIGGLGHALSCRVMRQLNGAYELEMVYPASGRRYAELKPRRIIYAGVGPGEEAQPFRIYRVRPGLLSTVTVYARHIAYDLMGHGLVPFSAESLSAACAAISGSAMAIRHSFAISADFDRATPCSIAAPRSVWAMMGGQKGSLLDIYNGEWDFDHFSCTLRGRLGADRGFMVRYGKNLQSLEQDENLASTWTAVQPYWQSADGLTVVTLPEITISAGVFDYTRVLVWDASEEFAEPPTVDQLRSRTRQYISSNAVGKPHVGLDVKFLDLAQTEEYKHRRFPGEVHLGDTVTVEFPTLIDHKTQKPTATVRTAARVVETVWLPKEERYDTIRIGSKKSNFVSVVAQQQKELSWVMTKVGR